MWSETSHNQQQYNSDASTMSDATMTKTPSLVEFSWCSHVSAALYEFCENGALCDTIIHTKDAQLLSAHANVLAAASPVLKEQIVGNMTRPFDVKLGGISADVVRKLLRFIYCGTLEIDMSDVTEVTGVMEAAASLQLDYITRFCAEHLLKKDDETFCIQTKIEGLDTDESGHRSADVVDSNDSASDTQFEPLKSEEARDKMEKPKRTGRKVNGRYAKRFEAIKQAVETPEVKDEDTDGETTDEYTPEEPYSCMQCGRRFGGQRALLRHARSHSDERPYVCNECGRGFRYTDNLVVHLRTHTGEHPFPCPVCERRFKSRYRMLKHFRSEHRGVDLPTTRTSTAKNSPIKRMKSTVDAKAPCLCPVCGKMFKRNKNLLCHARIHLGVRFTCDTCGKQLVSLANLAIHERIHRNEKPYMCSTCGRAFLDQSSCRRHEKIHADDRPHKCPTCGKGFIQKYAFTLHQRTHRARAPAALSAECTRPEQSAAAAMDCAWGTAASVGCDLPEQDIAAAAISAMDCQTGAAIVQVA